MISFIKKNQKVLKFLLLFLVLFLIGKFISTVDFNEVLKLIRKSPLSFLGVLIVSAFAVITGALAWYLCLGKEMNKTNLLEMIMVRHVGDMLSIFNPTSLVAGESLKILFLNKKGINKGTSVSSVLLSRIILILAAILLIIVSSLYLVFGLMDSDQMGIYIVIIGLVLIGLGYLLTRFLLHKNLYLAKRIEKLHKKYNWSFLSDSLVETVYDVNTQMSNYYRHHKSKFIGAFFFSIIHWIFGATEFFIILRSLDIHIPFIDAIAIEMGVILFKSIGAVVPGQIGVEDYGNKVMLDIIGVTSNEIWLLVTLIRRSRQLFWLAVAFLFMWLIPKITKIKINFK